MKNQKGSNFGCRYDKPHNNSLRGNRANSNSACSNGRKSRASGLPLRSLTAFLFIFLFLAAGPAFSQDELNMIRGSSSNTRWIQFSDARNTLYHHLAGEAYGMLEERAALVSGLQSLQDWQGRQRQIRETLLDIIGPFPERTPLNARILHTIEKEFYRLEHIVFESQPGFYVTSSMYTPHNLGGKAPAILYLSGHAREGYRSATYQHKIVNLVRKGFVVFAIDPVGQGERLEYYDPEMENSEVGIGTREHSYVGTQAFITGSSLARYMVWDMIRAVDYLVSRSEVDPDRIGATGRSGGGTQTAYLAALDERIYAAAPEAWITSFERLLQTIGPQDAEQNLYHGLRNMIDHADFLTVRAPMPTLLITTSSDFFSIQGARETAAEVARIYEAYGKEEHFGMVEDFGKHESTQKNREAMYAFFQHHLQNPGNPEDEQVAIPDDDELRVTPTGQLATSFGGETVFHLNRKEAEQRMEALRLARRDPERHLPEVLKTARELSGYREPSGVQEPVYTGRIRRDGYVIEKYFVPGEGDYVIPYLLLIPDRPNGKALIYLHPSGKAAGAEPGGELEGFVSRGFTVLAPDMVGTGELGGGEMANYTTRVREYEPVSFDVWTLGVLTGRSITAVRASDVARLVRLLKSTYEPVEIYGVARQRMAPVLLHAAAFEPLIDAVALLEPYASYRAVVTERFYDPGFHIGTVAGSIGVYDLPDLAASLAPKKLLMAGVTDGAGNAADSDEIQDDLSVIRKAYKRVGAADALKITNRNYMDHIFVVPGRQRVQ